VASKALIASSVMSKKLAGGAAHVLLDVKVGDGAFLADPREATDLAELCVSIGEAHGRRTGALVTDMSQPLGAGVGNAIEIAVAIEVLRGERPDDRLTEVSLALAAAALELTGVPGDEARGRVEQLLADGHALDRFRAFVAAQGGDPAVVDDPRGVLPSAPVEVTWTPPAGSVHGFACRRVGELAGRLGAGRQRQGDTLDLAVGLEVHAATGDRVDGSTPAVTIHARTDDDARAVLAELPDVVHVRDGDAGPVELVQARVGLA
jgi:pyrimidine-nucleoside phosphorylase